MAKQRVNLGVGVNFYLDPQGVAIDEKKLLKQSEARLKGALKNVQVQGTAVKIAPTLDIDPRALAAYKKQLQRQLKDIASAADLASVASYQKESTRKAQVAAALRSDETRKGADYQGAGGARAIKLANTYSEASLKILKDRISAESELVNRQADYAKIARSTQEIYARSSRTGAALTKQETAQLDKRLAAATQLKKAYTSVERLAATRTVRLASGKAEQVPGIDTGSATTQIRDLTAEIGQLKKATTALTPEIKGAADATRAQQRVNQALAKDATAQVARSRLQTDLAASGFKTKFTNDAEIKASIDSLNKLRTSIAKVREEAIKSGQSSGSIQNLDNALQRVGDRRAKLEALRASLRQAAADQKRATASIVSSLEKEAKAAEAAAQKREEAARLYREQQRSVFGTQFANSDQVQRGIADANKAIAYIKRLRDEAIKTGKSGDQLRGLNDSLERLTRRRGELQRLAKSFSEVERGIRNTAQASRELNGPLGQSSLLIRQFLRYALGYGALYKLLGLIHQLTSSVLELDKAMFSIQAITASTDEQMSAISASIKEVAVQTKYTTTEVAKAAQVLAQAGVDPNEINSVLNAVATFAAGTESSIAIAADLVSTMRNVFKDLDDLTIANQLTKAVNISKLTAEDLKTILGISAQVSKSFNLSSEQYLSAVTTLRNAGLKASTVATGLRQGLLEIFSPDSKSIKDLKQRYADLGEALTEQEIRTKFFKFTQTANPLLAVLRELDRLGFNGEGRKTLARSLDIRAANAIRALIDNIDELEKSETRLSIGNSALEASATQMDSLSNSIDNLGAAMTVLASDITDGPIGALEDLVDAATEAVKALDDLHTASLAKGGQGLVPAIQTGVAGAIAGATLGRTPAQRALGGAVGAAGGAYVGGKLVDSDSQDLATNVADLALFLSVAVPLLSGIGKALAKFTGGIRALRVEALIAGIVSSTGLLGKFFGAIAKMGRGLALIGKAVATARLTALPRLIAGLGARLIPFFGWLYVAWEVVDSLFNLTESKQTDLEKLNNQIKGQQRRRIKSQQEAEAARADVALYQLTDLESGVVAEKGKAAAAVENLDKKVQDFQFVLSKFFGDLTDEQIRQVYEIMRQLRTRGVSEGSTARTELVAQLNALVGASLDTNDETLIYLTNSYNEMLNGMKGVAEDITQTIQRTADRLADGKDVETNMLALYNAFEEVAAKDPAYLTALYDGIETLPFDQFVTNTKALFQRSYEIGSDLNHRTEKEELALREARNEVQLQLRKIRLGEEVGGLSAVVNKVLSNAKASGVAAADLMQMLADQLDGMQRDFVLAQRNYGQLAESAAAAGKPEEAAKYERLRAAEESKQEQLGPARAAIQATMDAMAAGVRKYNEDTIANVRDAVETVAMEGPELLRDSLGKIGKDKALSDLFDKIAAVATDQAGLDKLIESLTQYKDAAGKIIDVPFAGLLKALTDAQASNASVPDSARGHGRESPLELKYLRDPERYRRIQELEVAIEKAEKNNLDALVDINSALNPIVALRNEQLAEARGELEVAQQNLQAARTFYNNAKYDEGDDKRKKLEAINKAEVAVLEAQLKVTKVRADAEKAVNANLIKLKQQGFDYQKRALEADKKEIEARIKAATSAGNADALAALQDERYIVEQDLISVEGELLGLQESRAEVVDSITAANRRELEATLASAEASEYIAAMQQRLRYSQGDYTTGNLNVDAYEKALGRSPTREQRARSLQPQLEAQLQELIALEQRYNSLDKTLTSNAEAAKQLGDQLDTSRTKVGQLRGELESLTEAADGYYQAQQLADLSQWQVDFQALNSDITNFSRNLRSTWVNGFDELGGAISDAVIEGGNLKATIKDIFFNLFKETANTSLRTLFNAGIQKVLGVFTGSTGTTPTLPDLGGAVSAGTVTITAATVTVGGPGGLPSLSGGGETPGVADAIGDAISSAADDQIAAGDQNAEEAAAAANNGLVTQSNWFSQIVGVLSSILSALFASQAKDTATQGAQLAASAASAAASSKGTTRLNFRRGGGRITGKGTGTSDSIPALVLDKQGKPVVPINVSNGESILTAKATDLLGDDFITRLNAMTSSPMGFSSGGVIDMARALGSAKKDSGSSRLSKSLMGALAGLKPSGQTAPQPVSITLLDDRKAVEELLKGPLGEKTTLMHIQRNRTTVQGYTR